LRENISIIPQSPFVFSENIRKNLDPLDEFKDNDKVLWQVLEETNLKEKVDKLKE
jgi:ATP-binding cassette, subfamily C (CFTR/MRP), member 4